MCATPFTKKINGTSHTLPCGKCVICKGKRISGWSFRLQKESEISDHSIFLTLTYTNEQVPRTINQFKTVSKRDCQLYFKKLRKKLSKTEITFKYYLAAEYGDTTLRPHYHAILLFKNPRYYDMAYLNDIVTTTWDNGSTHIGKREPASVAYTLKYISKKTQIPIHKNDDRIPEFSLMSKKMGLNYITPQTLKWHLNDLENRMYIPLKDGKKISMPMYYKKLIYSDNQRRKISSYVEDPDLYISNQLNNLTDPKAIQRLKTRLKPASKQLTDKEYLQNQYNLINLVSKSNKETRQTTL